MAGRARLAADVEPEAGSDAATLIGAERLLHVRMILGSLDGRGIADVLPGRAVQCLDPVLGGILLAQRQGIDAELIGQLVETALDPVRRLRAGGLARGRDL